MELIDKAAVVAEIKRLISIANSQYDLVGDEDIRNRILWSQQASVCSQILSFLDTIEVKEMDLEEDVDRILEEYDWNYDKIDFYEFAKHFYELGIKTKKGE